VADPGIGGRGMISPPTCPFPLSLPCHKAAPLNPARGSGGALYAPLQA